LANEDSSIIFINIHFNSIVY